MLAPPGTKSGIFVKPGYRAVAVKIDAGSGVDYHLEPGGFVDVVGSFKLSRGGKSEVIARTIVENAEIAAVGPRVSPTTGGEGDKKDKDRGSVRAVTLFVKPEDVPKLLLTEQQGRIKLSLRGNAEQAGDESAPERYASEAELTGEVMPNVGLATSQPAASPLGWLHTLLGGSTGAAHATAATPPTVPRWVLKIYRGSKEEVVQFKNSESSERVDDADASPRLARSSATPAAPRPEPPTPKKDAVNPGDHPEPQEVSE